MSKVKNYIHHRLNHIYTKFNICVSSVQICVICGILFLLSFTACNKKLQTSEEKSYIGQTAIIPVPLELIAIKNTYFKLDKNTTISIPTNDDWALSAKYLKDKIQQSTGAHLAISQSENQQGIVFKKDNTLTKGAYSLSVNEEGVNIQAASSVGAFYAVQSLLQLMPVQVFDKANLGAFNFKIPAVQIKDEPRFPYRGMHLDVCRHFFSVDDVKRYIDLLAIHKFNYFHWHLTEDQGWRIEIKQYPKLTEVGAYRNETLVGHYNDQPHQFDGKRYGGFYTQEEVKEVIAYANARFITIIPEIEMPGHAQAAIAAYPELGCTSEKIEVLNKWGISEQVYCPTEKTFDFLENVLNEVMDIFPGQYIHIGGDECPKIQWKESEFCQQLIQKEGLKNEYELQSYFIRRIEKIINARGKRMIGWDEILEGGLAPNATVMSWRGMKGGLEAASEGHDVIMTPTSHCYFDYYQSQHKEEPLAIGGFLPIEKVYSFNPIPEKLDKDKTQHIIGVQANLWTEYIPNCNKLDYMAYPRTCALAEVGWSSKERRNFKSFVQRLESHFKRLNNYGVKAAQTVYDIDADFRTSGGKLIAFLQSNVPGTKVTYTLDGSKPRLNSSEFTSVPIPINNSAELRAAGFVNNERKGRMFEKDINIHKAAGKSIELKYQPAARYSAGGTTAIINGIKGSDERYGDKEWLGFEAKDLDAIIDLNEPQRISSVNFRFFKGEGQWIYLPKKASVYFSMDGSDYELAGETNEIKTSTKIASPTILVNENARYLKIIVKRYGKIPEGAQGAGHEAWLFVDEITVD